MESVAGTGSFSNLKNLLKCEAEESRADQSRDSNHEQPSTEPCSSSQPSTSLLDILIKAEHGLKQGDDANDPLDGIGDIGDAVINQLAGKTIRDALGETVTGEDDLVVQQNALKLFDEAMSYTKPIVPQKRKYTRWKSLANSSNAKSSEELELESIAKQFQKSEVKVSYPRANFNVSCAEMFQNDRKPDEIFQILHGKLEEERNQLIESQVAKDVDRLLAAATKVYGPRDWTNEEKKEFGKYCKNLRSNRGLTSEDQLGIKNFYANAYKLDDKTAARSSFLFCEEFRKANGMPPGVMPRSPATALLKRKTDQKVEDMDKKKVKEEELDESGEDSPGQSSLPPVLKEEVPFTPFHPGMKYEKEKVFRTEIIHIFMELFITSGKKRGRPKRQTRLAVPLEPEVKEPEPMSKKEEDLCLLITKLNEMMGEDKTWSQKDTEGLERFYDTFKERMSFTIIQTKELGNYLRKVFGRLEKYELERENDTALQEKRKYWQEYKRSHEPVKKERKTAVKRLTPVRPYIRTGIDTTGESEEQRRARKAAYLREWRSRRAEKQHVELCSQLVSSLANSIAGGSDTV